MSLLHSYVPTLSSITYVPVTGISQMVIELPHHVDLAAAEFILFSVLVVILVLPFLFGQNTKKENL